ncbi:MAG TPA: hypothetical protein VN408_16920 [Actinoplanes sp.]|nr:hypothetical protein [Actinoplanes sp.]
MTSAVIFAAAAPFGTALLTRLLPAGRELRVRRVLAVAVLTPLFMFLFSLPTLFLDRTAVLWAELAVLVVAAAVGFRRRQPRRDLYPPVAALVYLAVMALLWTA